MRLLWLGKMFSHAMLRNIGLPLIYFSYIYLREQDTLYNFITLVSTIFAPLFYLALSDTWEKPGSFIQYYIIWLILLYLSRESKPSYRFTASVCTLGAIGYFYEVPKWLALGVVELIKTSQYSIIVLDFGLVSAILYLIFLADYTVTETKIIALTLYWFYALIYITHLNWLWWTAYYLHIQPLLLKRLPTIILVLSLVKSNGGECK